ncbi:MAG: hypothetical protein ACYDEB_14565 [Dehalococcoidia bacterium]
MLKKWAVMTPPSEARSWHQSVEEWLTTMAGGFEILSVAGDRPQYQVDGVLRSFFSLRDGMTYELDQLNRQYARLFAECL